MSRTRRTSSKTGSQINIFEMVNDIKGENHKYEKSIGHYQSRPGGFSKTHRACRQESIVIMFLIETQWMGYTE